MTFLIDRQRIMRDFTGWGLRDFRYFSERERGVLDAPTGHIDTVLCV